MPPIQKPLVALLVPLSASTDAVIVDGRSVSFLRGREVFRLDWREYARLLQAHGSPPDETGRS